MSRRASVSALLPPVLALALLAAPSAAPASGPGLLGPAGLVTIPTARIDGGFGMHEVGGSKILKLNFAILKDLLEAGYVKDRTRDTANWNAKLALLSEDAILPAISVGAWGFSSADEDASQYFVASKTIPYFGGVAHLGYLKRGRIRSLASLLNYRNPISVFQELSGEHRAPFFGLEYPLFPLVTLMGEFVDETVNAGVRVSPIDSLVIDLNYLDVRDGRYLKDRRIVHFKYRLGF